MKKVSLKNIQSMLSRKEMRFISGGYGPGGNECLEACSTCTANSQCCSTVCSSDQPACGEGRKCLK